MRVASSRGSGLHPIACAVQRSARRVVVDRLRFAFLLPSLPPLPSLSIIIPKHSYSHLNPVISPALFQAYPSAPDEWTLAALMRADGSLEKTMETHYDTFIVSFLFSSFFFIYSLPSLLPCFFFYLFQNLSLF
jgi:hypothetical protein